nr:type II CAAX endopeptidase family protein [Propionicimonas sp.]
MIDPFGEVRGFFRAALLEPVDRDHSESPEALVQRRWISSTTLAVGAFMLAWTLRLSPGDPAFYAATLALATTWIVGGLLSGKVHLGRAYTRSGSQTGRGIIHAVVVGTLLLGLFLAGAALVAPVPALRDPLVTLLDHARYGVLPVVVFLTALNAVGEELFFRGALYAAVGDRQALLVTTLVYALTTIPSGLPLMVLAAALLGLVTGLQRRVTGGVLAPIVTHLIWSLGMLLLLPLILGT